MHFDPKPWRRKFRHRSGRARLSRRCRRGRHTCPGMLTWGLDRRVGRLGFVRGGRPRTPHGGPDAHKRPVLDTDFCLGRLGRNLERRSGNARITSPRTPRCLRNCGTKSIPYRHQYRLRILWYWVKSDSSGILFPARACIILFAWGNRNWMRIGHWILTHLELLPKLEQPRRVLDTLPWSWGPPVVPPAGGTFAPRRAIPTPVPPGAVRVWGFVPRHGPKLEPTWRKA